MHYNTLQIRGLDTKSKICTAKSKSFIAFADNERFLFCTRFSLSKVDKRFALLRMHRQEQQSVFANRCGKNNKAFCQWPD